MLDALPVQQFQPIAVLVKQGTTFTTTVVLALVLMDFSITILLIYAKPALLIVCNVLMELRISVWDVILIMGFIFSLMLGNLLLELVRILNLLMLLLLILLIRFVRILSMLLIFIALFLVILLVLLVMVLW